MFQPSNQATIANQPTNQATNQPGNPTTKPIIIINNQQRKRCPHRKVIVMKLLVIGDSALPPSGNIRSVLVIGDW